MVNKCKKCDCEDEDIDYYRYHKEIYCHECLYNHFIEDGIVEQYFEQFLDTECDRLE